MELPPSYSSSPPPRSLRLRLGGQGVFGPGMFGVSCSQVFADLKIRRRPEATEAVGDLNGAVVGAGRADEDRHAAAGDLGNGGDFLRRSIIFDSGPTPSAHRRVGSPPPPNRPDGAGG